MVLKEARSEAAWHNADIRECRRRASEEELMLVKANQAKQGQSGEKLHAHGVKMEMRL